MYHPQKSLHPRELHKSTKIKEIEKKKKNRKDSWLKGIQGNGFDYSTKNKERDHCIKRHVSHNLSRFVTWAALRFACSTPRRRFPSCTRTAGVKLGYGLPSQLPTTGISDHSEKFKIFHSKFKFVGKKKIQLIIVEWINDFLLLLNFFIPFEKCFAAARGGRLPAEPVFSRCAQEEGKVAAWGHAFRGASILRFLPFSCFSFFFDFSSYSCLSYSDFRGATKSPPVDRRRRPRGLCSWVLGLDELPLAESLSAVAILSKTGGSMNR